MPDENDDKPLSLLEEAEEEAEGDEGHLATLTQACELLCFLRFS